jgi:cell division protease FtsH
MKNTAFQKMIGYEEVKLELLRILDRLQNPGKYERLGVTTPNNILLYGEPGVGKTMFARCFMDATGWKPFICRKSKPDGDFVNEITRVFEQAEADAPAVLLLDDLDKFANEEEGRRDAEEFVTVQSCIDRVKGKQVFVIATANNKHKLPDSLMRAGRFDQILRLQSPSGKEAEQIVAYYLSQRSYVADVDAGRIARLLAGSSCAELETVINMAGIYAGFENREQIEMDDLMKAILRIMYRAPELVEDDGLNTALIACHEAGHGLIAQLLEPGSVDLVCVHRHHGNIDGITALHQQDDYFQSKKQMENRVLCLLAGKAATELCYGITDTGAGSDLRRAFRIVDRFVGEYCSFGFDKCKYTDMQSDALLSRREQQAAAEMDRYYARVKRLLVENRSKLDVLMLRLQKEKILLGDQIREIVGSV